MNELQKQIKRRMQASSSILITSHVRPDGDAIGSSLALALALEDAGKRVQVVLADGLPTNFKHLPGANMINKKANGEFDLIISVDCSDIKRVGDALDNYHPPDIVIDHHATTGDYGEINLIDPKAAATASVLTRHLTDWGLTITPPIATNLITGLITDTLGFRTSNTTPEVLRQTADLMEFGVDMSVLYLRSLVSRTFVEAKYWGAGLNSLERKDGIVWATLTLADRKACGYTRNDDADLISMVSAIDDADVAIMFVEQDSDKTKISWRGLKPQYDVSRLAREFDGGGHKAASGAEQAGSLEKVKMRVLEATQRFLNQTDP